MRSIIYTPCLPVSLTRTKIRKDEKKKIVGTGEVSVRSVEINYRNCWEISGLQEFHFRAINFVSPATVLLPESCQGNVPT